MKKIMIMALMVATTSSAFAQDDLVKQAAGMTDKYEDAVKTITPALTSSQTADKAKAWNTMVDIQMAKITKEQAEEAKSKITGGKTTYDTLGMNKAAVEALNAALQCENIDKQPNEKGKVKPKYRKANADRMLNVRSMVINSGLYEYNHHNNEAAYNDFSLYVESAKSSLFEGKDMTKDQYMGQVSYYAGLLAYGMKNYEAANKYADIAMKDTAVAADAAEIKIFAMKDQLKSKQDSINYLAVIKDLHIKNPKNEKYTGLLIDFYGTPGHAEEMKQFADEEIARDPNSRMAWALKGEYLMNNKQWDEAVEAYKKAAELDPSFVQVIFNIGICYNSKALEMNNKLADKMGRMTTENLNKVKSVFGQSKVYLEKVKGMDPNREKVNWAYPLYQVYYALGDQAGVKELEPLVK